MRLIPHDYQHACIDDAVAFATGEPFGSRRLYVSPTGSGKSVMMRGVQERLPDWWIITPRVEIIGGFLDKIGYDVSSMSQREMIETGLKECITTPIRYKESLLVGQRKEAPGLLIDEAHHDEATTWKHIHLLCGKPTAIGWTATPFRGTPKGTAALLETWGDPVWVMDYKSAMNRGVIAIPTCSTVPLLDDDLIEVVNGELSISKVAAATKSLVGQVAELSRKYITPEAQWDRPTMYALPTREASEALRQALDAANIPCVIVDGETPHRERQNAFDDTISRKVALIQIGVVSEGVDLPLRRIIDLRPTMSPVIWLQLIGRVMRPAKQRPEYLCTNRNILRHGYLLDGCLPSITFAEAQAEFPPTTRSVVRSMGFEAIGRFVQNAIPLANGIVVTTYSVSCVEDNYRSDYFCLIHPAREEIVWAKAKHYRQVDGTLAYSNWTPSAPPATLEGFSSTPPRAMTDKMKDWWTRSARTMGIHPDFEPNRREFQILPVLCSVPEARKLLRGY